MATTVTFPENVVVQGNLSARTATMPAGSITAANIEAAAGIETSKCDHRHTFNYYQTTGTAVVAETVPACIIRGATGTLVSLEAAIVGAIATDASRTVAVNLLKSTGAGAFATVLSANLQFTSSSVLRTTYAATINTAGLVDGDILEIVITVAGGSGNQAQGLVVTLTYDQDAS